MEPQWWHSRRDQLLAMAGQASPVYVFNEETLNEMLFDLLSIDVIDRLFYPVHANSHSKILRKGVELGVGFRCISCDEMEGLLQDFRGLDPKRILFFPVAAAARDFERAFDRGVQVVVDDLNVIRRWPDVFRNRSVFIRGNMGGDPAEIGVTGTSVQGFYCSSRTDASPSFGPEATPAFFARALSYFPEAAVLIVGNSTEQDRHPEQGFMDIPALGEYLEDMIHSCFKLKLWLELPYEMLACAGVLITRVVEVGDQAGTPCIRVDANLKAPLCNRKCGISHRIVNLSRPDSDEPVSMTRIIGQTGGAGNWIDLPKAPAIIEQGDALILTGTGAPGAGLRPEDEGSNGLSQHYLHARSMCRVRI
jgi:bifunctional diaminopimelate decarboxylase / aspartate kinase